MSRRNCSLVAAILLVTSVPAAAQWLNVPTKGIPRTKDGKLDLAAPAPREADGKPDLSGIWDGDKGIEKYHEDIAADFKPREFPILPWAEALTMERTRTAHGDWPPAHCLPTGIALNDTASIGYPHKIIQEPGHGGDSL